MKWEVKCPHCGARMQSYDSYGDSKAMLQDHIDLRHPASAS